MPFVDLEEIRLFTLDRCVYEETIGFLRANGKYRAEGIVIWAGKSKDSTHFLIDSIYIPKQSVGTYGARVSADEIDRIYRQIYKNNQVAIAQVHSHPCEAFHSDTDDESPVVTRRGALSIVVPYFGIQEAADIRCWAIYRFTADGWREIPAQKTIRIEEPE